MSRGPEFRFVLVDLAIVLALGLVGWVLFRLGRVEPQFLTAARESQALREMFREGQHLLRENTNDLELTRRKLDLSWYDASLLKAEYFGLADRLEAGLPELKNALTNFAGGKGELPAGLRDLQSWIDKQSERVSLERLEARSKGLQEQMARAQLEGTNPAVVLSDDLGTLMTGIGRTYLSCLAALRAAAENAGKPLVGSVVAQRLDRARQDVLRLSQFVDEARRDGTAIERFLAIQDSTETVKRRRRQEELIQALSEAESPAEFTRRFPAANQADISQSPAVGVVKSLRLARYGLVVALCGLSIFLILDLYWRVVVVPLRLKLVERESQIDHQKKLAHFEELAAELAHEIRNPLTAISALLYTVQRKLPAGTPEHKDSTVIRNELDRVNQILKEFIQMTRPTSPKLELMSAAPLLKEVTALMSPQLERQAVRLESEAPSQARFYGDQQQLKQVLINLIQNAAESFEQVVGTDHKAEVVLRARDERIPFQGVPEKVAIIEVVDNGPGIRPEVQGRLFEPFFSTKKTGTGLGLPISARIIDRHGGKLDFETQPGRTTFRIVIPAHEGRN